MGKCWFQVHSEEMTILPAAKAGANTGQTFKCPLPTLVPYRLPCRESINFTVVNYFL